MPKPLDMKALAKECGIELVEPLNIEDGTMVILEADYDKLLREIERLRAALVSIGILNASLWHPDPDIDKVIREVATV